MVNATITIPCTVNEDATTPAHNFTLTWFFKQQDSTETVLTSSNSRYSINSEDRSLTISRALYQDAGVYTCRISNVVGTIEQDNFVVIEGESMLTMISLHEAICRSYVRT